MINGYVDIVTPGLIEGWAFDRDAPEAHLRIDVVCDGRALAAGVASEFRVDLATNGIGQGDHAFKFGFDNPLSAEDLSRFIVLARRDNGLAVEIARWSPKPGERPNPAKLTVPGDARDTEQRPVFVFGAARSGTSAVAQGLLRATPYRGNQEGHLVKLIGGFDGAIARHYEDNAADLLEPRRNTMIKMVGADYFEDGVASLFVAAMRQLFPAGLWLDKTPEAAMTLLAPRLAEIWPNARFIFMRRRALENLTSRRRKFPEHTLAEGCRWWSRGMDAWAKVRPGLVGRALELDQLCVARTPHIAASQIGALLDFDETVICSLAARLAQHRPEQTADDFTASLDRADLDWTKAQWETFEEICGGWMSHFNYSRDRRYFECDRPDNWFVRV